RDSLAASRDPQWNAIVLQRFRLNYRTVHLIVLAIERHRPVAPGIAHDLHALVEPAQPHTGRRKAVTVCTPLVFVPTAADAHLDATAGNDVDGSGHLRQIDRV